MGTGLRVCVASHDRVGLRLNSLRKQAEDYHSERQYCAENLSHGDDHQGFIFTTRRRCLSARSKLTTKSGKAGYFSGATGLCVNGSVCIASRTLPSVEYSTSISPNSDLFDGYVVRNTVDPHARRRFDAILARFEVKKGAGPTFRTGPFKFATSDLVCRFSALDYGML